MPSKKSHCGHPLCLAFFDSDTECRAHERQVHPRLGKEFNSVLQQTDKMNDEQAVGECHEFINQAQLKLDQAQGRLDNTVESG